MRADNVADCYYGFGFRSLFSEGRKQLTLEVVRELVLSQNQLVQDQSTSSSLLYENSQSMDEVCVHLNVDHLERLVLEAF